jgi:hypothetical protein
MVAIQVLITFCIAAVSGGTATVGSFVAQNSFSQIGQSIGASVLATLLGCSVGYILGKIIPETDIGIKIRHLLGLGLTQWFVQKVEEDLLDMEFPDADIQAMKAVFKDLLIFTITDIFSFLLPPAIRGPVVFILDLFLLLHACWNTYKAIVYKSPLDASPPGLLDEALNGVISSYMFMDFKRKYMDGYDLYEEVQ